MSLLRLLSTRCDSLEYRLSLLRFRNPNHKLREGTYTIADLPPAFEFLRRKRGGKLAI